MMKLLIDTNNIMDLQQFDFINEIFDFDIDDINGEKYNHYWSLCGTISKILKKHDVYGNVKKINFKLIEFKYIKNTRGKFEPFEHFLFIYVDCLPYGAFIDYIYFDIDDSGCHTEIIEPIFDVLMEMCDNTKYDFNNYKYKIMGVK